jgi:hypothetical protein
MKKILISISVILTGFSCFAGGGSDNTPITIEDNSASVTNIATTVNRFNGDLYGIYIDVAAGATNTLVIATAKETVLTATAVTADAWYRPVTKADTEAGVEIAAEYIPFLLVNEPLTITVTTTDLGTNDVSVIIRTRE